MKKKYIAPLAEAIILYTQQDVAYNFPSSMDIPIAPAKDSELFYFTDEE